MELKPGMIIGEDIVEQGRVLYPAGTKIDQHIIHLL